MGQLSKWPRPLTLIFVLGWCAVGVSGCSQEGLLGSQYVTPGPSVTSAPQVTVVPPSLVGSSSSGQQSVDHAEQELVALMQGSACLTPEQTATRFRQVWLRWFSDRGATSASQWSQDESFQRVVTSPVAAFRDLCPAEAVNKFRLTLTKLEPLVAKNADVKRVWAARSTTNP